MAPGELHPGATDAPLGREVRRKERLFNRAVPNHRGHDMKVQEVLAMGRACSGACLLLRGGMVNGLLFFFGLLSRGPLAGGQR